jgi:hypothetical protein
MTEDRQSTRVSVVDLKLSWWSIFKLTFKFLTSATVIYIGVFVFFMIVATVLQFAFGINTPM